MTDYDIDNTDEITCPECGHKDRDSWEFDGDYDTYSCNACGEDFKCWRDVAVTYSTEKIIESEKSFNEEI